MVRPLASLGIGLTLSSKHKVEAACTVSLLTAMQELSERGDCPVVRASIDDPIDIARERMALSLLDTKAERLLLLDSDVAFTWSTLHSLLDRCEAVVSAVALRRTTPGSSVTNCLRYHADERRFVHLLLDQIDASGGRDAIEVDAVGLELVVLSRRVLESTPRPWFETLPLGHGEDLVFWTRVRRAGHKIHVVIGARVHHLAQPPELTSWRAQSAAIAAKPYQELMTRSPTSVWERRPATVQCSHCGYHGPWAEFNLAGAVPEVWTGTVFDAGLVCRRCERSFEVRWS